MQSRDSCVQREQAPALRYCLSIYVSSHFPFWFWGQDVGSDCISSWSLLIFLLRSNFETLTREIKAGVRKQHDLYVNNWVGDVKANPRDFYRYINSQKKKDTQDIPRLKRRNGNGVAQSDLEKAEEFNGQFTDVFSKNEYTQVPLLDRFAPFMDDIVISKDGVTKPLKGLNPSRALRPGELHPRVLKELATELCPVFAHLFQQSIDTGEIQRDGLLQIFAPFSRKVTDYLRAVIARFPWVVYFASYSST